MKKTIKTVALATLMTVNYQWSMVNAQEAWSVDQCMAYAVAHNHLVHQKELEVKNNQMDKLSAIGNFIPSVDGGVSARYGFGRGIDPETNVYDNISTFHNNYFIEASMLIFQDNTALDTFQAYIQALYCMGTVRMAKQKLAESDSLLYKARLQEEIGMKGMADVAQMEAQQATDAYNYTHQQHLFETAMLTLKQKMNCCF